MSLRLFVRLSVRNISRTAERIFKTFYILELCEYIHTYIHSVDKSSFGYNQIKVTCRPVACVCIVTRQIDYWSEECFQQYFQRKMEHILRPLHFLCKLYSFEKSERDLTQHNCYFLPTFRIWKCMKMWLYSIILTALYTRTYFAYAFFTILLASLTSLFSYCTYISGVAKPFCLHIAYRMLRL
jgi:hypothetical protein